MTDLHLLPPNQPADRFYRGGARLADLRGEGSAAGTHVPEDWIASTVSVRGEAPAGSTVLADGRSLRDAVEDSPEQWFGPAHLEAFGADPLVLTKVLDAGERLPVHVHPDGDDTRAALGEPHGKAEAWYILTPGEVHVGFTRDLSESELAALVDAQDSQALLEACNRVDVAAGDCVYVPPGCPHAIGEGVLLVEVQEPADISLLLEHERYGVSGDEGVFAGMGRAAGLAAVDRRGIGPDDVESLVVRADAPGTGRLARAAAPYFRLDLLASGEVPVLEQGYQVLVILDGEGTLAPENGTGTEVRRGSAVVVPFAAGAVRLTPGLTILVARPPFAAHHPA